LLFLIVLIGVCKSDTCISVPASLTKGANCGYSVSCQQGLYCGQTGVCETQVAAGQQCNTSIPDMCAPGTQCVGPVGGQTCIAYASPGEPCSNNFSLSIAECGTGQSFCVGGICTGGQVGDSCFNATDCQFNLNCTGGICQPIVFGGTCECNTYETFTPYAIPPQVPTPVYGRCISDLCAPGSSCQDNTCTPFLAPGSACTNSSLTATNQPQCPPNYYCLGSSPTDPNYVCIANGTLTAGDYCDQFPSLCSGSLTCVNRYCAKLAPQICQGSCSPNDVCECNGLSFAYGYGQCETDPCLALFNALQGCIWANCARPGTSLDVYAGQNYAKSCLNLNCANEFAAYNKCSDASRILPYLAIILALLAVFFNTY